MTAIFGTVAGIILSLLPIDVHAAVNMGFEQKLDSQISLHSMFHDELGRDVELAKYFTGKPVILVLSYYRCPNLCTLVLNGLVKSLADMPLLLGRDYDVINISIDPRETPNLARMKKRTYLARYLKLPVSDDGPWHFLMGNEPEIQKIAQEIGFSYEYEPISGEYAHPSGFVVLTPNGVTSRYFFGIQFDARELNLALISASRGKIGSIIDRVFLSCFHYDPETGKYGLQILMMIRIATIGTVLGLTAFLFGLFRKEARA